jgi:beta-lactamase class A
MPDMAAAEKYAHARRGIISFAVATRSRFWGFHETRTFPSASVHKAMLLVAYLNRGSVRHRDLRSGDRSLLWPMITRSDNNAASRVLGIVGTGGLRALARRTGMRRFTPVGGIWGLSRIDAEDQAHFFLKIDRYVTSRHRDYAMHLLASITPSQRWGIGRVSPTGWKLYFKGGWGSGTGWVDHQVALLRRGRQRVAVAILTHKDGSHAYGKATLQGLAARLTHGLTVSPSVP